MGPHSCACVFPSPLSTRVRSTTVPRNVANVANVAGVSGSRAFSRFTPEAGYTGYIGYKPLDKDATRVIGRAPPKLGEHSLDQGTLRTARARRARWLQRRISARRTRNASRSGRISLNYILFVYFVANVANVARASGSRAFLRFTPEAGYNGYIGYKPGDQDVLGRAPPRCGEDSQDQGTLRAARARRASRLQTRDQCATNTYGVLFWSHQLKSST